MVRQTDGATARGHPGGVPCRESVLSRGETGRGSRANIPRTRGKWVCGFKKRPPGRSPLPIGGSGWGAAAVVRALPQGRMYGPELREMRRVLQAVTGSDKLPVSQGALSQGSGRASLYGKAGRLRRVVGFDWAGFGRQQSVNSGIGWKRLSEGDVRTLLMCSNVESHRSSNKNSQSKFYKSRLVKMTIWISCLLRHLTC